MRNALILAAALATTAVLMPSAQAAPVRDSAGPTVLAASAAPVRYSSCAKLHKKFAHGVGLVGARDRNSKGHPVAKPVTNFTRNKAWYLRNKGLDRDHDGIACEAH